jgi:hypothetical protein
MKFLILLFCFFGTFAQVYAQMWQSEARLEFADGLGYDAVKLSKLAKDREFLTQILIAVEGAEKNVSDEKLVGLARQITVRRNKEKNSYSIFVTSFSKTKARKLATLVAQSLNRKINQLEAAKAEKELDKLDEKIQQQEEVVAKKRAELQKLLQILEERKE